MFITGAAGGIGSQAVREFLGTSYSIFLSVTFLSLLFRHSRILRYFSSRSSELTFVPAWAPFSLFF